MDFEADQAMATATAVAAIAGTLNGSIKRFPTTLISAELVPNDDGGSPQQIDCRFTMLRSTYRISVERLLDAPDV